MFDNGNTEGTNPYNRHQIIGRWKKLRKGDVTIYTFYKVLVDLFE